MSERILGPIALFLLLTGPVSAQNVSGHLEGTVVSEDALPIRGADVRIMGVSGAPRALQTDSRGRFSFAAIPVGTYVVTVSGPTIQTVHIEGVTVTLGERTTLGPIAIRTTAIELDPLVVTADATEIDLASVTFGTTIVTERVEDLPLGRDYQSTVALLPHANTSYLGDGVAVAGNTGLENLYFIDGVNVTAPYQATRRTKLPYNFISQLRVRQGGYSVRDGGALGAVVDAVTHTGGDKFELDVFGFFANKALAAGGRVGILDLEERHFETYDVGLRASGPVVRGRLWYSLAYNPLVETRERRALNLDFFEDRRVEHRVAAKVTWRAGMRTDVEASVFGDPTSHDRVAPFSPIFTTTELGNPDPFLWRREEGGLNFAASLVHRWDRGNLEAGIARSTTRERAFGRTETGRTEPFFHDPTTGYSEGGALWDEFVEGDRSTLSVHSTLIGGPHTWTVGGKYAIDQIDYTVDQPDPGLILSFGGQGFGTLLFRNDYPNLRNRAPALFVEDRWEINDRLTATLGLRWEHQALFATGDSIAQSFSAMWQPRVALSYDLGARGRNRLFVSAGRFYQRIPLQGAVFFYSEPESGFRGYAVDPRTPGATPLFEGPSPTTAPKFDDVKGEHHDQLVAGWDRTFDSGTRVSVRAVAQSLRRAWVGALEDPDASNWIVGNPGYGALSFFPEAKRSYRAVEVSAQRQRGPLDLRSSYVYSRSRGNYTGLFSSDMGVGQPNNNWTFRCPYLARLADGPLPNDRPHVFKLVTSYLFGAGVSGGAFFALQSGTPRSEFAHAAECNSSPPGRVLWAQRGSAGRLPTTWDLDLRLSAPISLGTGTEARLVVDLLNVGNPRRVLVVEQLSRLSDGSPNPTYGNPLVYQAPMSLRIGFEVGM
jgi:hypothetical protein